MKDYQPPADDPFADILDNDLPKPVSNDNLVQIYRNWQELHEQTQKNLMAFEVLDFELSSSAVGSEQVAKLVSIVPRYATSLRFHISFCSLGNSTIL
jgi:hypothetical protein